MSLFSFFETVLVGIGDKLIHDKPARHRLTCGEADRVNVPMKLYRRIGRRAPEDSDEFIDKYVKIQATLTLPAAQHVVNRSYGLDADHAAFQGLLGLRTVGIPALHLQETVENGQVVFYSVAHLGEQYLCGRLVVVLSGGLQVVQARAHLSGDQPQRLLLVAGKAAGLVV